MLNLPLQRVDKSLRQKASTLNSESTHAPQRHNQQQRGSEIQGALAITEFYLVHSSCIEKWEISCGELVKDVRPFRRGANSGQYVHDVFPSLSVVMVERKRDH